MNSKASALALPLNRLELYLRARMGSSAEILSATEFSGGASNPTFRIDSNQGQYVLRSKPQGKLVSKAHAIDREYRVIDALGTTDFPVPKAMFYCDDAEHMSQSSE